MNISLNWLKKHIKGADKINPKELGLKLTMATVEVEEVKVLAERLNKIAVGKVIELKPHPNADKLRLVLVDLGKEKIEVVCGGSNLKEEMLVAFAAVGSRVQWHGDGELIELKPAKIRGVESQGMICASSEIGLGDIFPSSESHEILDLTSLNLKVGESLAKALDLNEVIYDIDNKSLTNRPDLWGHYGMAREVSAIYGLDLITYKTDKIKQESKEVDLKIEVKEKELCPNYCGLAISNIEVGPSPAWLKKALESIGQKSINNIVDITNYILFDLGQPMHAFDATNIKSQRIIVRKAKKGEKLTTLDEEERELDKEMLVIADAEKAIALAGVIGGNNSEISLDTKTIILEAANFQAENIRKTSTRLGLRTESSMRFEKNLDPSLPEVALEKAVELVKKCCPKAIVSSSLINQRTYKESKKTIDVSYEFLNKRIGQEIPKDTINKILTSLGFELKNKKDSLLITVPSWRATKDISIPEDIVEEIARMYGYDNLTPVMPSVSLDYQFENKLRNLENKVRDVLVYNSGATEVYNYSFVGKDQLRQLDLNSTNHLELVNPWTDQQTLMRQSLVPNLLNNVVDNLRFYNEFNLFEVGKVFIDEKSQSLVKKDSSESLPLQDSYVAGVVIIENEEDLFFEAKGVFENLINILNLKGKFEVKKNLVTWNHPKRSLSFFIGKEEIGFITELNPVIAKNLNITKRVVVWQLNLNLVLKYLSENLEYKPVNKFPKIERDLAVIVEEKVLWQDIEKLVLAISPQLIKGIKLFDVYKNDKIGVGKKSLAFRIVYQSEDKTLEVDEINILESKVIDQLRRALGVEIRK